MKTNVRNPSAIRSAESSSSDNQDHNVNIDETRKTVSNVRIIKALGYRCWCFFKHKWLLMSIFIAIPILITVGSLYFKATNGIKNLNNQNIKDVVIPKKVTFNDILRSCSGMYPIGASPDNADVRHMMEAVSHFFNDSSRIKFGPVVFTRSTQELSKHMASGKKNGSKCGFGINFLQISPTSLSYTLRSVKADGWYTDKLFPDTMEPGPMDNGRMYLENGFLALQMAINYVYFVTLSSTAKVKLNFPDIDTNNPNLTLQDSLNMTPNGTTLQSLLNGRGVLSLLQATLQGFPYPAYQPIDKEIRATYGYLLILPVYGIILTAAVFGLWIIREKISGMKELLKVNGIKTWMIYASWFFMFGLITLIIAAVITVCWKYPLSTGAILPNSSPFVILTILIVYFWSTIACIGFLCSLVRSPIMGIALILLYFIVTDILPGFVPRNTMAISFMALIPTPGMTEIFGVVIYLEDIGTGAYYTNLFDDPQMGITTLPIGVNLLLMIAGMLLYIVLMAYIDAIKPGPYGRARPWCFVLNCCRFSRTNNNPASDTSLNLTSNSMIEKTKVNKPIGLKVVNLGKKFGYFQAVDGLNLTIYKNEITVLLGHNGAGKSTLFNMICGMYSPTSGNIYTESYNVFSENHLSWFRRDLGYCPQHDLLFSDLSVQEHLVFFGMVKGFTKSKALEKSDHWTKTFNIYHRRHKTISQLSGGMKRKVCLSIALVGDPQYLLLDEPTSGLDPESRRDIWDILLSVRGDRTVVITTHDMEEAEVLGDRIAIIANGNLKCFGTAMFLKQHYGLGYQLKISLRKDSNNVLNLIQGIVPSARLLNKTGKVMTVSLPAHEVTKFPALFSELDLRYKQDEYSLSATSMGDVFITVQEQEGVNLKINAVDMPFLPKEADDPSAQESTSTHVWQTFVGLTKKRCIWARCNWTSLVLFVLVIPVVCFVLVIISSNASNKHSSGNKNLSLDLALHKNSIVFIVTKKNDSLARAFESLVTTSGSKYKEMSANQSIVQVLLDSAKTDLHKYRSETIVALESGNRPSPNALYSTLAYHSAPILCDMLVNAYLQEANLSARISTHNFPYESDFLKEGCREAAASKMIMFVILIVGIGLLIAFSYFVVFPHTERITLFKHLQIMTGAHTTLYWIANLIVDVIFYLIGVSLSLLVLLLIDTRKEFSQYGALNAVAAVLYLYGFSCITFCYLASYLFKNHTFSMMFVIFLSLAAALVCLIAVLFRFATWSKYVFYLIPWVPFAACLSKIFMVTTRIVECKACAESTEFCEKIGKADPFFGITTELIYLAADPFVYLAITLLNDIGIFRFLIKNMKLLLYGKIEESDEPMDANVLKEKLAVEALMEQEDLVPTFVCDGLGKKYSRSVVAVHDVSFAIPKNEIFGLLGTNGAGKSTTFGMLTGIHTPTQGDASIFSYSLSSHRRNYLKRLGYCPQLDGLLPQLSARSHLMLFGRLRGIPSSQLPELVQKWIDVLDMTLICDRPSRTYSGGNKRKLSAAIALIGDPPVVLLDEPTTGVDQVVSRKLWPILKHCRDTNGQTIILTSHSMDECEATCERITIMVSGRMKCIGTAPYLKNTFGRGYVLVVKLKVRCTQEESKEVEEKVKRSFAPHIRLQDKQHGLFSFFIDSVVTLQKVFQVMISMKASLTKIEDFSVANISLEQVFMTVAEDK